MNEFSSVCGADHIQQIDVGERRGSFLNAIYGCSAVIREVQHQFSRFEERKCRWRKRSRRGSKQSAMGGRWGWTIRTESLRLEWKKSITEMSEPGPGLLSPTEERTSIGLSQLYQYTNISSPTTYIAQRDPQRQRYRPVTIFHLIN